MSDGPRRAVAVVLDGPATPAWQARALAALAASPALALVDVRVLPGRPRGRARRLLSDAERRFFAIAPDAQAPVALQRPPLAPAAGRSEPPLAVWLSEQPVAAAPAGAVLYARHAGAAEPAEQAFARAVLDGEGVVETEVLLAHGGKQVVVARTASGVRPFSATLSANLMLWKLAALIARAAERAPGLDLPAEDGAPAAPLPSSAALVAHALAAWARVLCVRALFSRPWSLRVRSRGDSPTRGWSADEQLVRFQRGHLYADPQLLEHAGRHHLFCEEVLPGEPHGVISHTELRLDGAPADCPAPVLRAPHHLSYPFVFAHEGELFMIPETAALRRVQLYRAVEFPRRWTREATLLHDIAATDATLLDHDGLLWLFASVAAPHASSLDELHVFCAQQLCGPWRAHPLNPVVSDVRCARPAGAVQRWGARLVRPGQDGSRRYGGAISFREIDVLSESAYAEHEIARLEPGDLGDARATHSYASDGRFEAVDLRRRRPRIGSRLAARTGRPA